MQRAYLCIDLKSFYASVECIQRGLDPLDTLLTVADEARTEKTICLAMSPGLKAYGLPGRARLFEVVQRVGEINRQRKRVALGNAFTGSSYSARALQEDPSLALDYIVAPPRMAHYMAVSSQIYQIYLRHVAPEDIHVYSIDEVFMDVTRYLGGGTARDFAEKILRDVVSSTGITATAGIGTNLYLAKVAMDIVAKRIDPDENGVRIAQLDEMLYRQALWAHRPLTDFWRVGRGIARKLEKNGICTMGDVARCSVENEQLLYRLFGKNAELLIDHAWGWEPCTIADIRAYRPSSNSISAGQVLQSPYSGEKAALVLREMADRLAMDLVERGLVTDQIVITLGYDVENLTDPARRSRYRGEIVRDAYGRELPRPAHGSYNLKGHTASTREIVAAAMALFERITDQSLLIRRLNITANHVLGEGEKPREFEQLDLFADPTAGERQAAAREREHRLQQTTLALRKKFGPNALLRGTSYQEGATARERNGQIGGHKA